MNSLIRYPVVCLFFAIAAACASPQTAHGDAAFPAALELQRELKYFGPQAFTASNYRPGIVRHIVMFRYQPGVSPAQKEEIKQRFLALKNLCRRNGQPYVLTIETGTQSSGEGADQGLEQAFIVTFKSAGDRNFYVGQPVVTDPRFYDPAHQAFKDFVGPLLHQPINPTGVLVFDYALEERR